MSVTFVAGSLLTEPGAVVTISVATVANFGVELLSDSDRADQCQATAAGQVDVDVVLLVARSVDSIGLANHNVAANLQVYCDTGAAIGTTLVGTVTPTGVDPFLGAIALATGTKWRFRFLNFGAALKVGELMPWVKRVVASPRLGQDTVKPMANVEHDLTIGNYHKATKLGPMLNVLPNGWDAMALADVTSLLAAFADCGEGSGNLFVKTRDGVLRWCCWLDKEIEPVPIGNGYYRVTPLQLQEAA